MIEKLVEKPIFTLKEILGLNEPERFKLIYDEIVAEKLLLFEIYKALTGKTVAGEDVILRLPESDRMYLDPNAKYEKEFQVGGRKLIYIAYDVPDGVFMLLYRNGSPYYWSYGEIGALELRNGISFDSVRIVTENKSSITQKWSVTMIFV